jgi:Fe-S-cluster containining protein
MHNFTANIFLKATENGEKRICLFADMIFTVVCQISRFLIKSGAVEEDGSEPCSLLGKDGRCTAYNARPTQCRTYPFWDELLQDAESWKKESVHADPPRESSKCAGESTSTNASSGDTVHRHWNPIDGGCEGISFSDSCKVVSAPTIRKALTKQRAWEADLDKHIAKQ